MREGPAGRRHRPYFTADLHLHTSRGSADSNLSPLALAERAQAADLDAIAITEHDTMWELNEAPELAAYDSMLFLRGMEVSTDMGHIGVFGLTRYIGGIYRLDQLRRVADAEGAILIANHPFRYRLDPRSAFINPDREPLSPDHPEQAAALAVFSMVDAVEVLNGACSPEENLFALKVARIVGAAEVGGSDSHSAASVGCVATLLDGPVADERGLIEAIRARRCRAGRALAAGVIEPFELG